MRWLATSVPSPSVRGVGELVRSTLSGREELELLRWSGKLKVEVEALGSALTLVGGLSASFLSLRLGATPPLTAALPLFLVLTGELAALRAAVSLMCPLDVMFPSSSISAISLSEAAGAAGCWLLRSDTLAAGWAELEPSMVPTSSSSL